MTITQKFQILKKIALPIMIAVCTTACTGSGSNSETATFTRANKAIYYWRTVFELSENEKQFLEYHKIGRIYLRMFDVDAEFNPDKNLVEAVPIATTRFGSTVQHSEEMEYAPLATTRDGSIVPQSIEIVPTVFITLDALRAMQNNESEYAQLIIDRLKAMSSYNHCGDIREIQFDCDWTSTTRNTYASLCLAAHKILQTENIRLSCTIRLHQLAEEAPPVDSGVLMLYNTGSLKNPDTRNSILDINDVRPYLSSIKCNIPLDYAYPAFGWGVKFHDGKFTGIVSRPELETTLNPGDTIRLERPSFDEIMAVKNMVEEKLGAPNRFNILYHLDNYQLKNYSQHEISQIYYSPR